MKKVAIVGERKAAIVDAPDPQPVADWALVKVHVAPMCTEYKAFLAGERSEYLGHEATGEVVAVAQPGKVEVGDRVVVQPTYPCGRCALCIAGDYIHCEHMVDVAAVTGGREGGVTMAQYLLKPSWLLSRIPDGVPYERASLANCGLGPSFGAFQAMRLSAFDTVLIIGAGPVGMGAVVNALFRNARVIVVESIPWRVERVGLMGRVYGDGAVHVLDPNDPGILDRIKDLTGGRGADCALDCAGTVRAERLCIDGTGRKGRVAFVGECGDELTLRVSPDLLRKGLTVVGSWHYNLNEFPRIMQVIERSPLIDLLVSHVLPMSEVQKAFEISASHESAKIILKPWE